MMIHEKQIFLVWDLLSGSLASSLSLSFILSPFCFADLCFTDFCDISQRVSNNMKITITCVKFKVVIDVS